MFDFGAYFLSHKWSEDFGMHIQVCSMSLHVLKRVLCPDSPGVYFNGAYITGCGKYLFDCTEAILYQNKNEVTDYSGFIANAAHALPDPFPKCVKREVFEQFGCDYDAWMARMMAQYGIENNEMREYSL